MSLTPELEVTVWTMPHHEIGSLIHIDVDLAIEGEPGGFLQSMQYSRKQDGHPVLNLEAPYTIFEVSNSSTLLLIETINKVTYSFREKAFTPILGGSIYGLNITRKAQKFCITWSPSFEDQENGIKNIFKLMEKLATT